MNLSVVLQTGKQSLPIILATISTSLIVSYVLHKAMKIPSKISTLIGVGSSICGGSAIAATAPVIEASDEEVAQSISVIFLFNMIAALLFPTLGTLLGFLQRVVKHLVFLQEQLLMIHLQLLLQLLHGIRCFIYKVLL